MSPPSTIRPTFMRFIFLTRCWCTAPAAISEESGTRSWLTLRSDSTTSRKPSSIACSASSQMRLHAAATPAPPSERSKHVSITWVFHWRPATVLSSAMRSSSSDSRRMGDLSRSRWQDSFCAEVMSPSGPIMHSSDMTTASRTESRGGLVTCAKSCLKYS